MHIGIPWTGERRAFTPMQSVHLYGLNVPWDADIHQHDISYSKNAGRPDAYRDPMDR